MRPLEGAAGPLPWADLLLALWPLWLIAGTVAALALTEALARRTGASGER